MTINQLISKLRITLERQSSFKTKINALYELEQSGYNITSLLSNEELDAFIIQLYLKLGYHKIVTNDYNKDKCEKMYISSLPLTKEEFKIFKAIKEYIKIGEAYQLSELKLFLQIIYDNLNIKKNAKATDIMRFYDVKCVKKSKDGVYYHEKVQTFLILSEFFKF